MRLVDTKRIHHIEEVVVGNTDPTKLIDVTVVLNPETSAATLLEKLCAREGLSCKLLDALHATVSGPVATLSRVFGVSVADYRVEDRTFHSHAENIVDPVGGVAHVIGFDSAPIVQSYLKRHAAPAPKPTDFTPIRLAELYNFPAGDGTGQTIGVIELGGGYRDTDMAAYFTKLGIPTKPNIVSISVDGAKNNPTSPDSVEVVLDTQIIAAIVPKATIRVYFAPNSDRGFYDAINAAVRDGVSIISISWGAAEKYWTNASMNTYNDLFARAAALGITILAAAGDNGASDGAPGQNCDFPCSSPYVLACGGTRLMANRVGITSETVWNNHTGATGGGVSKKFAQPMYQNKISPLKGRSRGVPDVSAVADPTTGYIIHINGADMVIGGTSAVAPLWAALLARINQKLLSQGKNRVGFANPFLYARPNAFRDVVSGHNNGFVASAGWDACTGLGSPQGDLIFNIFNGNLATAVFASIPPLQTPTAAAQPAKSDKKSKTKPKESPAAAALPYAKSLPKPHTLSNTRPLVYQNPDLYRY